MSFGSKLRAARRAMNGQRPRKRRAKRNPYASEYKRGKNTSKGNYYVLEPKTGIMYPPTGRGYSLKGAKDYARISSQRRKNGTWGNDRYVLRGRDGMVVRVYSHGRRVWPVRPGQLDRLTRAEHPRNL